MQARGRKPGVTETLPDDNDTVSSFLDCAVEIAQAIDNLEGRAEVISLIAIKYAEAGQLNVAADLAETINDSYQRDQAHAALAAKCVEIRAPDYAEKLCDLIEDDTAYALATEGMAVAYAESGIFEESSALAHRLTDSAPTLSRIALAFVARGHPVQALSNRGNRSIARPQEPEQDDHGQRMRERSGLMLERYPLIYERER